MKLRETSFAWTLCVSLSVIALAGCAGQKTDQTNAQIQGSPSDGQSTGATAAPNGPSSPMAVTGSGGASPSPTGSAAGSSPSAAAARSISQPIRCETGTQVVEITFQQGQAQMSLRPRAATANSILNNVPASTTSNSDGSTTYTALGETAGTTTTLTVASNGGCSLQVATQQATTLQETGRVTPIAIAQGTPSYQSGYNRGYGNGQRDGQNFRKYSSGYNPDAAFGGGSQSGDADFDKGFRDGFYAGFEAGYYADDTAQVPQSYQDGFAEGRVRGYREGLSSRRANVGYSPDSAFGGGAQSGDADFDQGFRDGFYAGFEEGYYGNTNTPTPQQPSVPALW